MEKTSGCLLYTSLEARRAHNPKVVGSNPAPAIRPDSSVGRAAVSYTHLDVYKRQWLERTPDKREVGGSSPLKPVGKCLQLRR